MSGHPQMSVNEGKHNLSLSLFMNIYSAAYILYSFNVLKTSNGPMRKSISIVIIVKFCR